MTGPAELRRKALPYLRDAKVHVLTASSDPETLTTGRAVIAVQGHRARHVVDLRPVGLWECTCGTVPCAHVAAAQLVTGHWKQVA